MQGNAKQNKTKQSKTKRNKTKQNKTRHDKTKQDALCVHRGLPPLLLQLALRLLPRRADVVELRARSLQPRRGTRVLPARLVPLPLRLGNGVADRGLVVPNGGDERRLPLQLCRQPAPLGLEVLAPRVGARELVLRARLRRRSQMRLGCERAPL